MSIQSLIEFAARRWQDAEAHEGQILLRLSLLRDLARALHAEKSRILSHGTSGEARAIQRTENKIESLKSNSLSTSTLEEALQSNEAPRIRESLPGKLFEVVDADKLQRSDRQWELAIAAEALRLRWNFWSVKGTIPIEQIEKVGLALERSIWPHGVSLFADSLDFSSKPPQWEGVWTMVFHAKIDPQALFPGTQHPDFSLPKWKLLFSALIS